MKQTQATSNSLGTFALWAIGVGLVISGQSFGWNLGWGIAGPLAFFIPFLVAALLYFSLIKSLTLLSIKFPDVEGPHDYISKALGTSAGRFIGFALLIEFLFATPAVATSIGEYLGFLNKDPEVGTTIAISFLVAFCLLNMLEIKVNIWITILLTLLAIGELLIYSGAIVAHFSVHNITSTINNQYNILSLARSLPFAIWIFLAIEGLALYTQFIKKDKLRKVVTRGYNTSFITLFVLAAVILLLTIGGISWTPENWNAITVDNHPMPKALSMILGTQSPIVLLFTFIGLFGLIASLQGVSFAATEQILVFMHGARLAPKIKRLIATSVVLVVGLIAILGNKVSFLIEFSVFGAVCLYIGIGMSVLRTQGNRSKVVEAGDKATNSKWSTLFAVLTILISLVTVCVFAQSQVTSFLICSFLTVAFILYNAFRKKKLAILEDSL